MENLNNFWSPRSKLDVVVIFNQIMYIKPVKFTNLIVSTKKKNYQKDQPKRGAL